MSFDPNITHTRFINTINPILELNPLPAPFAIRELRNQIFSRVSLDKDMASIARTCKSWNGISSDISIVNEQLRSLTSLYLFEIRTWCLLIRKRYGQDLSIVQFLEKCPNLQKLHLSKAFIDDATIHEIGKHLPKLKELELHNCDNLKHPNFSSFLSLHTLELKNCCALLNPKFGNLPSLQMLYLNSCRDLVDPNLSGLTSLQIFYATSCPSLINPNFSGLLSLQRLLLNCCDALLNPNFSGLTSLQILSIISRYSRTLLNRDCLKPILSNPGIQIIGLH